MVAGLPRMLAESTAQQRRRQHPPAGWLARGAWAPAKVDREGCLHAKCSKEARKQTQTAWTEHDTNDA